MTIVGTLCIILMGLTLGAAIGKIQLPEFEQLLGVLGITSIFSAIAQAFIHSNIGQDSKSEEKPKQLPSQKVD